MCQALVAGDRGTMAAKCGPIREELNGPQRFCHHGWVSWKMGGERGRRRRGHRRKSSGELCPDVVRRQEVELRLLLAAQFLTAERWGHPDLGWQQMQKLQS